MYGMPLPQALFFLALAIVFGAIVQRRLLHPFLGLVAISFVFGWVSGFSSDLLSRAFGTGFSQALLSPGLVIVGAAFVAAVAEGAGATERLRAAVDRLPWLGSTRLAALLGLIAGAGSSVSSAFVVLTPLLHAISRTAKPGGSAASMTSALAMSASHSVVLLSPVPIVVGSILGASWSRLALFGLPLAVLLAIVGAMWARALRAPAGAGLLDVHTDEHIDETKPAPDARSVWPVIVLLLAAIVPLLMLIVQSIGDMPSEPFGGGPKREMILGFGRPLILFVVGIGIVLAGLWRVSLKLLPDPAWAKNVISNVAAPILIVGAAVGLQSLCQEAGMAESLGERLLELPGGLWLPFCVAALIKTLQGSSLVAAITAAGMIQPMLGPLGLAGESGRALATLAVGAGAMTASHINDDYFWVTVTSARLSLLRGLATLTAGTLLQGLVALAALYVLSFLTAGG